MIAVDADSRWMNAEMSATVTEQVVREQMRSPRRLLYKKLDSTLRGNVGSEVAAALKAFCDLNAEEPERQSALAVIAPAFPKSGRTTVDGRQFVNGVPLVETEMWEREGLRGCAHIPQILRSSGLCAELIPLELVRCGPDHLYSRMLELRGKTDAVVCDAETDQDLQSIATASVALAPGIMWAGSAGLAHHLMRIAEIRPSISEVKDDAPVAEGPTLFVIGSLASISRRQVRELANDVRTVCVSPGALRSGKDSLQWKADEQGIRDGIRRGYDAVVYLRAEGEVDMTQGRLLSGALANLVAPCAPEIGALVLSGGETAREVLKGFEVTRLRLIGELEPGLPLSVTEGSKRTVPVFTKAGDFGNPQSLVHCHRYLRQLDRSRIPVRVC